MEVKDLYELADADGITIDAFALTGRPALSVWDGERCYIAVDPFKIETTAEEKTVLGHELGHCEKLAFYNLWSPYDIRQRQENRANKWAIKKLVPEDELKKAVRAGIVEPWDLAERFQVTEQFMRLAMCWYRYGSLDVKYYGVA